jgi:hypothetical protein
LVLAGKEFANTALFNHVILKANANSTQFLARHDRTKLFHGDAAASVIDPFALQTAGG